MKELILFIITILLSIYFTLLAVLPAHSFSPKIDFQKLDAISVQIEAIQALEATVEPLSLRQYATQEAIKAGISSERFIALIDCESKFDPNAKNKNSSATGLLQWITSSWEETDSYKEGFSPYNPYASIREAVKALSNGDNKWVCWK